MAGMKKTRWLLLGVVAGAAVGVGVAIAHSMHQATRLPAWYSRPSSPPTASDLAPSISAGDASGASLSGAEVEQWVRGAIAQRRVQDALERPVANFSATVEAGELKTGTLINLSELPTERLGRTEQRLLERAIALAPGLANREVFVGLESQPTLENGRIVLGDNATVQIGELRLPLRVVAQRLGVSVTDLEQQITELVRSQGIDPADLRIEGDRLWLSSD